MRSRPLLAVLAALALLAVVVSMLRLEGAPDGGAGGELAVPAPVPTVEREDAAAPAPVAEPPPPPPVPASRPALQARLEALLRSPHLPLLEAQLGVAVRDEEGRTVIEHHADRPLLPASTMKLVTAAAALATFGPEHRFRTVAGVTQPVTRNGTVVGDLVLVGAGDPVLATPAYQRWVYPTRPRTPLEELADAVVDAGVRRITGGVVGDGSAFTGTTLASGWPEHYLADLDARHISGLTVDAGLATRIVEHTDPPEVTVRPVEEPAALAAAALARLLRDRGISIERGARAVDAVETTPVVETVGAVSSPPLHDILVHMVRRSDNQVADTLLRTTAVARAGTGSWSMGALAARASLASLDVDAPGVVIADGSGLSRNDRLSAALLADLDLAMGRSLMAEQWWGLMAVAGREGTLRGRLRGTLAEGRLLGKTGTLADVQALAGVVLGDDGRRYHFAVIANHVGGVDRTVVTVLMDELVLALAEDLAGCRRRPVAAPPEASEPPSPPHVPAYELDCPAAAA